MIDSRRHWKYLIMKLSFRAFLDILTLFCPKIPSSPDLFFIFPPVMVPRMEVFFSEGVPCGVLALMFPDDKEMSQQAKYQTLLPDTLSREERSSKGMSPGGRNPLLYFSITRAESWVEIKINLQDFFYRSECNSVSCLIHHVNCEI